MKKIIILFLGLSILFLSCQRNDEIIGVWVRNGDEFSGLKVQVIKKGNILNGVIIHTTKYAKASGFIVNDIKWKGIKHIEGNNYEFDDLGKGADSYGNIATANYYLSSLVIENNVIKTRLYTKGAEVVGTEQIWIREK